VFTGELNGFLWLCIAIWSFDRFLRLARVTYLGLIPRFAKGKKVTAIYDPSADIIRLDVTALLPNKTIEPGEYYYLYAACGIKSYQSHPFTLCSWQKPTTTIESSQTSPSPTTEEDAKKPQPTTLSTSPSPSNSTPAPKTNHTLLIRPHTGFTASLKAGLNPSPRDITILLEGPYGRSIDLRPFTDVLFLVGGSGITAAISHLSYLLPSQNKRMNAHLVWAVPNASLVDNVCENELAAAVREPSFRMTVYQTRGAESLGSSELEKNDADGKEFPYPRGKSSSATAYTLLQDRPDFFSAIRDARRDCVGPSLAVVSCGPPRMADACRRGVVQILGDDEGKGPGVEFFNEAMGW
jgi:NAD(P)H-flavin reductase